MRGGFQFSPIGESCPMKTFVRCGQLFTGQEDEAQTDAVLSVS